MRKNYNKKKFFLMLLILLVIGLSIGYAILTEQLSINNTINYEAMKWDVRFTKVFYPSDFNVSTIPDDIVLGSAIISEEGEKLSISCDLGKRTERLRCSSAVLLTNNSTFDVSLDELASGVSLAHISSSMKYFDHEEIFVCIDIYNCEELVYGYVLKAGESRMLALHYIFNELTPEILPENDLSFEFEIDMNWIETENGSSELTTYEVGQEVSIGVEKFNVVRDNGNTVTMLAKYNVGSSNRQDYFTLEPLILYNDSYSQYFSNVNNFDIHDIDSPFISALNDYVYFLQYETGDYRLSGDLLSLYDLRELGCTINDDYTYTDGLTCKNSKYAEWLIFSSNGWTIKSLPSNLDNRIWHVESNGDLLTNPLNWHQYLRPVITVSKYMLMNQEELVTFSIDDVLYEVEPGMTWSEWVNSSYYTSKRIYIDSNEVLLKDVEGDVIWDYEAYLTEEGTGNRVNGDDIINVGMNYQFVYYN